MPGKLRRSAGPAALTLLALLALTLPGTAARADVVISEVMASNGYFEDGHAWDWVELHNEDKAAARRSISRAGT